ncbi:MAG: TonB-dependent receptor [Caldimonas sp.]
MGGFERAGSRELARARHGARASLLALAALLGPHPVVAQTAPAGELAPAAPAPSTRPATPAAPAAAATPATPASPALPAPRTEQLAPVQITGSRPDDVQERRQSTAAKIVIGREEIERFGDATLGDVLKRLPGVTIQGRPGRGGAIRLRGLGNGYTQILLDGERVPPGFSLDSLSPEQIERIEILRAPTAETGARAIAGTINIVTREGYNKRFNDVRLSAALENGAVQPSFAWTRNLVAGDWIVNYSLTGFAQNRDNSSTTRIVDHRLDDGSERLGQVDLGSVREHRRGLHATGRLQWRGEGGIEQVTLTPILVWGSGSSHREGVLSQACPADPPCAAPPYERSASDGEGSYSLVRLNAQWNHRLGGGGRIETRGGVGRARQPTHSFRTETSGGQLSRTFEDGGASRDTSLSASSKLTTSLFDEHSFVAGVELELNRREDSRTARENGSIVLAEFGAELAARALRYAGYAQDEWNVTPNWAAHAGLRWEAIATRGGVGAGEAEARNRSSVVTPLLHAVWKPDPKGRDQVRFSLTRSYRSPPLANLIARTSPNLRWPLAGGNLPTQPDRAGNPDLKPELANGIDIAIERYLPGSGLLSANVFRRSIRNYMRSVTTLDTVSYSPVPRYVARTRNVGNALTEGLELEAKFRLGELWAEAPRIDVRSNLSLFRSRVEGVPGPDNRLDQQPGYSANLGLDYRFRGLPLALGGNLNFTPAYLTRISDLQTATIGRKLIADVYGVWTFSPALALRVTASNLAAADYLNGSTLDGPDLQGIAVRESTQTRAPTFVNLQMRLEMKL